MSEINNQREFSRAGVAIRVEIERQGKETFSAVAEDVSLNGIRIASTKSFDADVRCDVKVILAEGEDEPVIIEAHGSAVRSDGQYIAIHFDDLELEGYHHLKKLILYHSLDSDQIEREFDAHAGLHRKR